MNLDGGLAHVSANPSKAVRNARKPKAGDYNMGVLKEFPRIGAGPVTPKYDAAAHAAEDAKRELTNAREYNVLSYLDGTRGHLASGAWTTHVPDRRPRGPLNGGFSSLPRHPGGAEFAPQLAYVTDGGTQQEPKPGSVAYPPKN
jgi:hypothetical protein